MNAVQRNVLKVSALAMLVAGCGGGVAEETTVRR